MNCWVVRDVEESAEFTWAGARELRETYTLPSAFKGYFPLVEELVTG